MDFIDWIGLYFVVSVAVSVMLGFFIDSGATDMREPSKYATFDL